MCERNLVGEVVIAENGGLQTVASYYERHLNLYNQLNVNGEHVMGFTGPETRIVSRRLLATGIVDVASDKTERAEVSSNTLEPNQVVFVA